MKLEDLMIALMVAGILILGCLASGCAYRPMARNAECHVLRVDEITEHIGEGEGGATQTKWLAWCGEGRYVVFKSSITPGEVVRFTEYQEDNQLQIYGAIEAPK